MIRCSICGSEVSKQYKCCPNCGNRIVPAETSQENKTVLLNNQKQNAGVSGRNEEKNPSAGSQQIREMQERRENPSAGMAQRNGMRNGADRRPPVSDRMRQQNKGDYYHPEKHYPENRNGQGEYWQKKDSNKKSGKGSMIVLVIIVCALIIGTALAVLFFVKKANATEPVDLFSNIEVQFSGSNGSGTAEVVIDGDADYLKDLEYTVKPDKNLSIGDKVIVTAETSNGKDLAEHLKKNYKLEPKRSEKKFVVHEGDLKKLIESPDDVQRDVRSAMQKTIQSAAEDSVNWNGSSVEGSQYLGAYLLNSRASDSEDEKEDSAGGNMLVNVSRIDVRTGDNESFSYYFYTLYKNVTSDKEYDTSDFEIPSVKGSMSQTHSTVEYKGYESLAALEEGLEEAYGDAYEITAEVTDDPKPVVTATPEPTPTQAPVTPTRTPGSSSGNSGGYAASSSTEGMIFPDSDRRVLTDAECAALSEHEVQTAINDIFARHGYIFEEDDWPQHYRSLSWYRPTVPKSSFSPSMLNNIEYANVEKLSKYRDRFRK